MGAGIFKALGGSITQRRCLHSGDERWCERDPIRINQFPPFPRLGTVELRRQAGVASAMTAIHRILFALTLHISAFRYDFDGAKARKTRPDGAELIRELAGCIKKLPSETCHG